MTLGLPALGTAAFAVTWAGDGGHLGRLIVGTLALDVAVRGTHLVNLREVYGLVDDARSRIASAYMTIYTLGGVAGAAGGTAAYRLGGWTAGCALGAAFMLAGLAVAARAGTAGTRRVIL